jgi:hypothetical protein
MVIVVVVGRQLGGCVNWGFDVCIVVLLETPFTKYEYLLYI